MYCNKCGKSNPDSRNFCSACGANLKVPGDTNTDPQFAWRQSFAIRFRYRWRELAASPLSLAMIICYCAAALLGVMQLNSAFDELNGLMRYIDLGFDLEGSIGVLQLLIITPNVLIAVGMWMLYADARQPADQPIKTTAIGLIRGTTIGYMVAYLCIIVVAVLASCSAMDELSGSYYSDIRAGLTGLILGLLLGGGLLLLYYSVLLKLLDSVREVAENCFPDTEHITFVAVYTLVVSGISLLGTLISGITFPALVSVASTMLIGIVLLQYKKMMEELSGEYNRIRDKASVTSRFIKGNAQTTAVSSESQFRSQSKTEVRKDTKTQFAVGDGSARFCPACGAAQTAQWCFCPACGFSLEKVNETEISSQ